MDDQEAAVDPSPPDPYEMSVEIIKHAIGNMLVIIPDGIVQRFLIEDALVRCNWNVTEAAHKLRIDRRTIYRRIRKMGLKRPLL